MKVSNSLTLSVIRSRILIRDEVFVSFQCNVVFCIFRDRIIEHDYVTRMLRNVVLNKTFSLFTVTKLGRGEKWVRTKLIQKPY